MQRLILRFQVSDGCTYSCTEVLPVEYESPEALLADFMQAVLHSVTASGDGQFTFLGHEFDGWSFFKRVERRRLEDQNYIELRGATYFRVAPSVLTLDQFYDEALRQS